MNRKFKDSLNVLVYGDIDKLKVNSNHHFFDQLSCVSDKMTQNPKTIAELNDYILKGKYTHVVIPDEHFHRLNDSLEKCVVPVVELLGDHWIPWAIERKKEYIQKNGIKHAFVFSERFHESYKNIVNFHPILTGYDSSTFFNQNKERKIDVLISGAMKNHEFWVYPVRNWLADILPEIGIKEGINIQIHVHPGRVLKKGEEKKTKEYANVLNQAKIATGGSSFWRLPLKKLYEIPACGTILLSDLPLEDSAFFKGKIMEIKPGKINFKSYADNLRKDIMNVLENYEEFQQKLQPFRTENDRFLRSYEGRALEMRRILKSIK